MYCASSWISTCTAQDTQSIEICGLSTQKHKDVSFGVSFHFNFHCSCRHFRFVSKLCIVYHGIFQIALDNVVFAPKYVAVRSKKTLSVSFRVERESGPPGCPNTRFLVCTYAYPRIPWYPGSCVSEVEQFIMICCALCYVSPKMIIKCSEGPAVQNVDPRCTKTKENCLTTSCTTVKSKK